MSDKDRLDESADYDRADFEPADFKTGAEPSADAGEIAEKVIQPGRIVKEKTGTPTKKVLVAGSAKIRNNYEEISTLAKMIGAKIMRVDNWILLNGGASHTSSVGIISVDHLVCIGAQEELGKLGDQKVEDRILTLHPEKVNQNLHTIGKVQIVKEATRPLRRFELAEQADAIITIEGGIGTQDIIEHGIHLQKPVLPIACTGGKSREAWDHYEKDILKNFGIKKQSEEYEMLVTKGLDSPSELSDLVIRIIKDKFKPIPDELRLATYIASDQWTTEDSLGYHMYAYAIAKFITNNQTKTPISISIQAPWGGGKTSLMRMIRAMLDKNAPDEIGKAGDGAGGRNDISQKNPENKKNGKDEKGKIKVKDLKEELEQKGPDDLPRVNEPESFGKELLKPRITIWFNAWKYESTEQVWAGLADSIVKGIADRLSPIEREWFYLRLNLRRRDAESIRNWITDYIWNYVWKTASPWIISSVSGVVASSLTGITEFALQQPTFAYAGFSVAAVFGGLGITRTASKKKDAENEPADVSLGKFVTVPDYKEKLGFIHHVKRDLDLVFDTIPEEFRELVIFIDDLDRCSPNNVAQVVEGINLFLAGEFPGCIFVIGMDAEMVAAALEVAHEKVIKKLPSYYAHMPIGWRFMDKFIQLPIIIPPSRPQKVKTYANTLLAEYSVKKTKNDRETRFNDTTDSSQVTANISESNPSYDTSATTLKLRPDQREHIQIMHENIERTSDTDEEFLKQISDALADFSYNPREIKRFINALRFQRFLMLSLEESDDTLSFDQDVGQFCHLNGHRLLDGCTGGHPHSIMVRK
jgi:hypothetical protein